MKFLNWVLEARKGNIPKVSIIEALSKYKNNHDIYISYTSLDKLGINPQYDFGTPLGIYFYPLPEIWRHIISDNVPFAGERKFVWVVKAKNLLDLDTYTNNDFWDDVKKLNQGNSFQYTDAFKYAQLDSKGNPGKFIWYLTHNLAKAKNKDRAPFEWTRLLRKVLGYTGIRDTRGIIHHNEPQQAIIFSIRDLEVVEKINNIRPDNTPRTVVKTLEEYIDLVLSSSTPLDISSIIKYRITQSYTDDRLVIIKPSVFSKISLEDFKYILSLKQDLPGDTIVNFIKDNKYDPKYIKAAIDADAIIFVENLKDFHKYISLYGALTRILRYHDSANKTAEEFYNIDKILIHTKKIVEDLTVDQYIDIGKSLGIKFLDIHLVIKMVHLILHLKGNKKDALGFFVGSIYPAFIEVEAIKDHPDTMNRVIDIFKRDFLSKDSLKSLEQYLDITYVKKYWNK